MPKTFPAPYTIYRVDHADMADRREALIKAQRRLREIKAAAGYPFYEPIRAAATRA